MPHTVTYMSRAAARRSQSLYTWATTGCIAFQKFAPDMYAVNAYNYRLYSNFFRLASLRSARARKP